MNWPPYPLGNCVSIILETCREAVYNATQNYLNEGQVSGVFIQQPSVIESNSETSSFSHSPPDLCRGRACSCIPREESHWKMVACLRHVHRQNLSSVKGACIGHQHHLTHNHFPQSGTQKDDLSFSFGFPFSGQFRPNFIFVSLSEAHIFEHLKTDLE